MTRLFGRLSVLALALALPASSLWGQAAEAEVNASALFHAGVGGSSPNVDLPAQVIAPEGKLTLFADFARADEAGTPLYLVNRTGGNVVFADQDGDISLKLEHQHPDGTWQRAQSHRNSDCGNSYGQRILPAGQHFKLPGYRASKEKATQGKVRYAGYGNVEAVSNEGAGPYDPADVEASTRDDIAQRHIPSNLHLGVYHGPLNADRASEAQVMEKAREIAALELLRILGGPAILEQKKKAERWAELLSARADLTRDESKMLTALQAVLARPWPEKTSQERLLTHCLEALRHPAPPPAVDGAPESMPALLWQTLAALADPARTAYLPSIASTVWKPVLELAAERVMSAPQEEAREMMEMLSKRPDLADEWVADAVFERCLGSPAPAITELAAEALARRCRWERLVKLGWQVPPQNQVAVLGALVRGQWPEVTQGMAAYGGPRRPDRGSEEERFWKHCMSTRPRECAWIWHRLSWTTSAPLPLSPYLRQQLFISLTAQADQDDARGGEFETKAGGSEERVALAVLVPKPDRSLHDYVTRLTAGEDGNPGLIVLLNRLLGHQGYVAERGIRNTDGVASEFEQRRYPFRDEAAQALKRLGQPVPEDLVIKREVTPAAGAARP